MVIWSLVNLILGKVKENNFTNLIHMSSSMANNELSGILTICDLMKSLKILLLSKFC